MSALQRTPVYDAHLRSGARMMAFAGFEMPVQYASIVEEHRAVRERAGLFDVSHMGQLHVTGRGAEAALERLLTCRVASLKPGRVRYGLLCNEAGGVVDDVTLHRLADDAFFLCVNASNVQKDQRWIATQLPPDVRLENRSAETALLALQGPRSEKILSRITDAELPELRRFAFQTARVAEQTVLLARTGYTGEDGFELYLDAAAAEPLWDALLAAGRDEGLMPVGLGARDTLRLEAALSLYGHELDDTTSPLEARLERFVKLQQGGFIGAEAIARRQRDGHSRLLAGFVLEERGIARAGYTIAVDGRPVGVVTSGTPSPTLGKSIGLGYVPPPLAAVDTHFEVQIRAASVRARVVETPFVRAVRGGS